MVYRREDWSRNFHFHGREKAEAKHNRTVGGYMGAKAPPYPAIFIRVPISIGYGKNGSTAFLMRLDGVIFGEPQQ